MTADPDFLEFAKAEKIFEIDRLYKIGGSKPELSPEAQRLRMEIAAIERMLGDGR